MPRLATTIALAAWVGFLVVSAAELAVDAISPTAIAVMSGWTWPRSLTPFFDGTLTLFTPFGVPVELAVSALCLGIAGLLVTGLVFLQSPKRRDPARAERFAFQALAVIAGLVLASYALRIPLLPVDLSRGLVWLALALSLAAILFDRMVAIEEDEGDDAEFEAGLQAIGQGMARQTRLYTPGDAGKGDTNR